MLRERLKKELLIFDGAMGSMLQKYGMKAGEIPEVYNIEHPEMIIDIHKQYLKAGAHFITTNTCSKTKYAPLSQGSPTKNLCGFFAGLSTHTRLKPA